MKYSCLLTYLNHASLDLWGKAGLASACVVLLIRVSFLYVNSDRQRLPGMARNAKKSAHTPYNVFAALKKSMKITACTNTYMNAYTNAYINTYMNASANGYPHFRANTHTNAHVTGHADTYSNTYVNAYRNSNTYITTVGMRTLDIRELSTVQVLYGGARDLGFF